MGSFLIQLAGVALVTAGLALMWYPLAFVFAGAALFGLGWLLDGDVLHGDEPEPEVE